MTIKVEAINIQHVLQAGFFLSFLLNALLCYLVASLPFISVRHYLSVKEVNCQFPVSLSCYSISLCRHLPCLPVCRSEVILCLSFILKVISLGGLLHNCLLPSWLCFSSPVGLCPLFQKLVHLTLKAVTNILLNKISFCSILQNYSC